MVVTGPISDLCLQPTRAEWQRFLRYASWMRQLRLERNSGISDHVLRMISVNSSNGILFPRLRELTWKGRSYPLERHFLSPHLTHFMFLCPSHMNGLPDELVSNLTSVVVELQTSSLQSLRIDLHVTGEGIPTNLRDAISSAVIRCGTSLTYLSVPTLLSDAATKHIMQLPKLAEWVARSGPPRIPDLSVSDAFPQLENLKLHTEASLEWLPLFDANTRRTPSGQGTYTPTNRGPCSKLTTLACWVEVSLDATFISTIMVFRGLVNLSLQPPCFGQGACGFHLTDDDIMGIATTLPNLEDAVFGFACSANSCRTTVSSLLFLSALCKNLAWLGIHFNTTNLRRDLKSMAENPRLRDLCALPKCQVTELPASHAPLQLEDGDYEPVVAGFRCIFPSLRGILGKGAGWNRVNSKLWDEE